MIDYSIVRCRKKAMLLLLLPILFYSYSKAHGSSGTSPTIANSVTTDLAGKVRVQQGLVDIGAYESTNISAPTPSDGIIYVKEGGAGNFSGDSWANATPRLQEAIYVSSAGDQVWVAAGEYQPALNQSFSMKEGVKIYGSFAGTEANLNDRDLSGGVTSILKGAGTSVIFNLFLSDAPLTPAAVLDGFKITGGDVRNGGGMYNQYSSPTLSNCIFSGSSAGQDGGGMFNANSSPAIINCIFSGNSATRFGGGMFNLNSSSPTIINCTFLENNATNNGGAMLNFDSSPTIMNSIIKGNSSGIHNLDATRWCI